MTKYAKIAIALSIVGTALLPIRTMSAPDWDVCVVDVSNHPVSKVLVREDCTNYSTEFSTHEQDLCTDAKGCVHFGAKRITSPALMRLLAILSSAMGGAHASFGTYSSVTAFGGTQWGDDIRNGYIYEWRGSPQHETSTLALHD